MISPEKYAPTNFVPAVAVIRRGRVLSVMTGRKGRVGCISVDGGAAITGGGKKTPKNPEHALREFSGTFSGGLCPRLHRLEAPLTKDSLGNPSQPGLAKV